MKFKIIRDKKQFSIRIPLQYAKVAKIDEKTDVFEFSLVPEETSDGKTVFAIEARLKHGIDKKRL